MKALIVVPTYNEIDNLDPLLKAVLGATPDSVDILVVDDGSPDGTGQLADAIAKANKRVHVLHRAKKMGLGTAYVNGFKWGMERGAGDAAYDVFIEMDADFSHDPKYLSRMLELLESKDVVIGSRYVRGGGTVNWGMSRKVISRGGSLYSRMILGAGIRDFTGGFNGWRRNVLEAVDLATLRSDGYSFQIELKFRAFVRGFKIVEFPIIFEDRKVGKSKMNKKIVFEALGRVWGFRWRALKQGHGSLGRLVSLCSGAHHGPKQ
jgi:dolichol-phosphate mannosyltransferase